MAKIGCLPILGVIGVLGVVGYFAKGSRTAVEEAVVEETAIEEAAVETTNSSEPSGSGDLSSSPSLEVTIPPALGMATVEPEPAPNSDTLPTNTIENISFDQCLTMKARTFAQLNARPISIVSTNMVTVDRVCVAEGSVLITCSAPDSKMVITTSPDGC